MPRLGSGIDVLLSGHQGAMALEQLRLGRGKTLSPTWTPRSLGMTAQAPGRPVLERRVDIPFPQVGGLHDMHVRVHDLKAVFRHTMRLRSLCFASQT